MNVLISDPPASVRPYVATTLGAENICVQFGGLMAIDNVSLSVRRREIMGLIGPNGAGKTTLVNCLSGFQKPSSGRPVIGDTDASDWTPIHFRNAGIGRTFQAGRLFREMTVIDNVEVTATSLGLSRRQARAFAMEVIEWIGIAHHAERLAGDLPYTDERRVGIARALVLKPVFLLLDEPAAGMSDHDCDDLMHLISEIPKAHDSGVLLIEHNMRVVMGVCDRIHVLDGGSTLAEGTPKEVQNNPNVISAYLGASA